MKALHRWFVVVVVLLMSAIGIEQQTRGQGAGRVAARPEVRGVIKAIDVTAGMITVTLSGGREGAAAPQPNERSYPVSKEVEVVVGGGFGGGEI